MHMLSSISREAQAYADLYHGRTLVIKVSGAEINSQFFSKLVEDIRTIIGFGINIILSFGGGDQINSAYSQHSTVPRTKIDGVGVTTREVLTHGVLPAYHSIREKLQDALPEALFVEPHSISCDMVKDSRFGLVGIPQNIVLPDAKLSVLGFTGMVGEQIVNVNADDIALQLAKQYKERIEELLLLTGTGGVLDVQREIVPIILDDALGKIIQGNHRSVQVEGGMLKKLRSVQDALHILGKVVITRTDGLENELLRWMGDGTMCVDRNQCRSSPLQKREERIFDAVTSQYVEDGIFRPRSNVEWDRIKNNHRVLRIGQSPLGGSSVMPDGPDWVKCEVVWAGSIGNGIGRMVLNDALRYAGRRPMYALSADDDAIQAFRSHGNFEDKGRLSDAKGSDGIPPQLSSYDTDARNPVVFIAKK